MIGHIINVICFFGKLDSTTQFKLVKAYCTSYYGCEMLSLWNQTIEDMCIAWRKGVRRFGVFRLTHIMSFHQESVMMFRFLTSCVSDRWDLCQITSQASVC